MEREFESYNKNIDDFDARNIFEFDALKELNKMKIQDEVNEKSENSKKTVFLSKKKIQKYSFNWNFNKNLPDIKRFVIFFRILISSQNLSWNKSLMSFMIFKTHGIT